MKLILLLLSFAFTGVAAAATPTSVICSTRTTVFQINFDLDVLSVKDSFGHTLWVDGIKTLDYRPDTKANPATTPIQITFDTTGRLLGTVVEEMHIDRDKKFKVIRGGKYVGTHSDNKDFAFEACELYFE